MEGKKNINNKWTSSLGVGLGGSGGDNFLKNREWLLEMPHKKIPQTGDTNSLDVCKL